MLAATRPMPLENVICVPYRTGYAGQGDHFSVIDRFTQSMFPEMLVGIGAAHGLANASQFTNLTNQKEVNRCLS